MSQDDWFSLSIKDGKGDFKMISGTGQGESLPRKGGESVHFFAASILDWIVVSPAMDGFRIVGVETIEVGRVFKKGQRIHKNESAGIGGGGANQVPSL